jgi:hypothetical protein
MTVVQLRKQCGLAAKAGTSEPCERAACAFWERSGCAIERLEIDGGGVELADFLLRVRGRLEVHSLFA